jgi:hypothetical protein
LPAAAFIFLCLPIEIIRFRFVPVRPSIGSFFR